jgi:pantothenate kinase-related protein Tda10
MVLGTSDEVDKVLAWRKKGDEKIIETVLQMLKDTNIIYDKEKWESARNLQEIHKQLWNKYQQIDSQCIYIVSFSVCLTLFDF